MTKPRVAFVTFGCRVNQYETDAMRAALEPSCDVVEQDADVYILNGCSVTALAEKKARQTLHRLRKTSPEAIVVLTGCLADAVIRGLSPFEAVDLMAGNAWKPHITDVVAQAVAGRRGVLAPDNRAASGAEVSAGPADRVRATLKVQDGCSGACAYCRAVQLRGPSRSKPVADAVTECRRLVSRGFPEIVVTGVNLAEYAAPDGGLATLADRLLAVPGLARLRLASLNVAGVTDALLDVFAGDPRFCAHFHMPLQSGHDGVLRAMRRSYTTADFRAAVQRVRSRLPHATFGSDIIVGFPGEDEAAFDATRRLVEDVGFSNLHIFRYSHRLGTEAAELACPVSETAKRERAIQITEAWRTRQRPLLDACIGNVEDVLVESCHGTHYHGRSASYLTVAFTSGRSLAEGSLCPVRVTHVRNDGLGGVDDNQYRAD